MGSLRRALPLGGNKERTSTCYVAAYKRAQSRAPTAALNCDAFWPAAAATSRRDRGSSYVRNPSVSRTLNVSLGGSLAEFRDLSDLSGKFDLKKS